MKRVFLDTNILIDYIQARAGGNDAKQLLMRGRDGEVTLCASFLTFANMAYILDGKADVYEFFAMLTGAAFGSYPAIKAASLKPVEALRKN